MASSAAFLHAKLPASGSVSVDGRGYVVRSFTEPGFAGERLRVWIVGAPN